MKKSLLACDGSEDSVFAIKQFANLLPDMCNDQTLLVYVDVNDIELPDLSYIEELAIRHFSNLTICKLDFYPQEYFATWLSEQKNSIVVTGSYPRSGLSDFFRKSFIKEAIQNYEFPIFITHQ